MKLSKNFTLKELTYSSTALRLGIDNSPSKEGVLKLNLLAASILQPLRDRLGALRVTSGYRSKELNRALGGGRSQHCLYEAVDLQYYKNGRMDNIKIYDTIIHQAIDFDQIILEFGDASEVDDPCSPDWIHISCKISDNRRQVLVAYKDKNNRTKYRKPKNHYS